MFLDTEQERNIDLGNRYKFDEMKSGECLINEQMAESLNVEEGDTIYTKMNVYQNLIALIDEYNDFPKGADPNISRSVVTDGVNSVIEFPCKIAHIGN